MTASSLTTSYNLERFASALSNWTVQDQSERDPSLSERYGEAWRSHWSEDARIRIGYLSQAVSVARPELFLDSVACSKAAFEGKEMASADLRQALVSLATVIERELPEHSSGAARQYLGEAIDRFDELSCRDAKAEPDGPHALAALRYLEAVLDGRRADAETQLSDLVAAGVSIGEIYDEVICKAQQVIGTMWMTGEVSVAEEHRATVIALSCMAHLRRVHDDAPPRGTSLLVSAVQGDLHEVAVRMIADLFEIHGWNVHCLGANTPSTEILAWLEREPTDLLALSVSSSLNVRDCAVLIEKLKSSGVSLPILVGGRPFEIAPGLWSELGADGCVNTLSRGVELAGQLCP